MKKWKNKYRERVTINGRQLTFYSSEQNERKARTEINRKIAQYKEDQEKGEDFYNVAEEWWNETERTLSVQSIPTYQKCLERAQDFFQCPIKDIDTQMVNEFLNELKRQKFAQQTIRKHRVILSTIFKFAYINGYVQSNPTQYATIPKADRTVRHSATEEDERKIAESPITEPFLLPYLCFYGGLRRGEAIALRWEDIDMDNCMMHIHSNCAFDVSRPIIKDTKTESGTRSVPIADALFRRLDYHKKKHGFVCSDKLMSHSWYRRHIYQFMDRYGITANPHELRHSFATNCLEAGLDVKTTSNIIGHKNISTTLNIYTDVRKKQIDKAKDILNSVFK